MFVRVSVVLMIESEFSLRSILLLAEGRTAYMGSRSDAIQYFDR